MKNTFILHSFLLPLTANYAQNGKSENGLFHDHLIL